MFMINNLDLQIGLKRNKKIGRGAFHNFTFLFLSIFFFAQLVRQSFFGVSKYELETMKTDILDHEVLPKFAPPSIFFLS